jgi:4-carboxymuconolactone decarboxylase
MAGFDDGGAGKVNPRRRFIESAFFAAASAFAISRSDHVMAAESCEDRFSRGLEILRRIGGPNFDGPINVLAEISADLSRFTVEYPYGDVLSRPGLDLPSRQLCTISMLLADGSAQPQLKFHMAGFLNAGGEPRVLVELLFVSVAVLGFPASIDAVGIVRSVFAERKLAFQPVEPATDDGTGRRRAGQEMLARLTGGDAQDYFDRFAATAPDLAQLSIDFAFGEALARDSLDHNTKLLAIIAMLAASGNRSEALRLHLAGALANGVTRENIIEVLIQLSVYRGFPSALNAFSLAREVFSADPQRLQVDLPKPTDTESRADRLQRGYALLARTSASSGDAVVRGFDDIAPDLGRMIVEHAYGEVFSRQGINLKTRELSACAALAAIGSTATETPLRVHINAALNVGASREEIVEALVNLAAYCGYPTTQRAVRIAAEEFAKRDQSAQQRKEEEE